MELSVRLNQVFLAACTSLRARPRWCSRSWSRRKEERSLWVKRVKKRLPISNNMNRLSFFKCGPSVYFFYFFPFFNQRLWTQFCSHSRRHHSLWNAYLFSVTLFRNKLLTELLVAVWSDPPFALDITLSKKPKLFWSFFKWQELCSHIFKLFKLYFRASCCLFLILLDLSVAWVMSLITL